MLIKAFIEGGKVAQLAKVGNKSVECEASVPYTSVAFVDARSPAAKNIKRGSYVEQGSDGEYVFTLPDPAPTPEPAPPKVSAIEFKLLWTPFERVALNKLRESDELLADFWSLIEDPRLTQVDLGLSSTQQAVTYAVQKLVELGEVSADAEATRVDEVLSGKMQ